MKLKPLEQWVCDVCGEVINKPEEGMLEFDNNRGVSSKYNDFIIVHHKSFSHDKNGCTKFNMSIHLDECLGNIGVADLMSMMDPTFIKVNTFVNPNIEISCIRKWVEIYCRLHIKYYEEARQYFRLALADNFFDGANETFLYREQNLKDIVDRYRGYT